MVPDVAPIDTGHPQPVPIVLDVVPIDRSHPQVVPVVPDVVPLTEIILHYSHLHVNVVCTSSPWPPMWSPETGDDIGDHIYCLHIVPLVP